MKAPFLLIAVTLLAACSDDVPPPQAEAAPPAKADVAVVEIAEPKEPAADPCDLRGYDMSKMTVALHEQLVKACNASK